MLTLTEAERRIGIWVGSQRHAEAVRLGKTSCRRATNLTDEQIHIRGALGELAYCKAMNVYWEPSINAFGVADIKPDINVKTRCGHHRDLRLTNRDAEIYRYALVTTDKSNETFRIHGWIRGMDARQPQYWFDPDGNGAAWWIPQAELVPF